MSRNKLYLLFFLLSLAGYTWVFWNFSRVQSIDNPVRFCLFKKITSLPCPSCGTTQSVLAIIRGNFDEAVKKNPLGFIVFPVLIILPVWILFDFILRRNSFYNFYPVMEHFIRRKWVAYPVILLLLMNWVINIFSHHGFH
jgi:hypothetical protein